MKKFYLIISMALLIFAGCKKDEEIPTTRLVNLEITTSSSDWEKFYYPYLVEYDAFYTIPEITANVIENGTVLAYIYDEELGYYMALPVTIHTGNYSITYAYLFKEGLFSPSILFNDAEGDNPPGSLTYKVVILEETISKSVNANNFKEVAEFYGLD